jgi:hypothetical protein
MRSPFRALSSAKTGATTPLNKLPKNNNLNKDIFFKMFSYGVLTCHNKLIENYIYFNLISNLLS